MREKIAAILKNALCLSLLLHLLLVLSFSLAYTLGSIREPKPSLEIPAYVYRGELSKPPAPSRIAQHVGAT